MRSSILLAAVLAAAGCAKRDAPYHFRAPLVTSVSAPDLRADRTPRPKPRVEVREYPARPGAESAPAPEPPVRVEIPSEPLESDDGPNLADTLRGMVGEEDEGSTHLDFARDALLASGAGLDRALREVEEGEELVALAQERGAFEESGSPLLGDLVVFDAVVGDEPASLIGVVVSADSEGTVEFVYLGRGVVRRGYVNPIRPSLQRDDAGRAVNTFVRGTDGGDPAGTRYLAGELFAGFIRLDALLR